ncbi:MAG TPA: hypothetical protein VLY24_25830, partial [Bryobacteraceae bacterium]|nr:hypothetical protein [Bryobacteraceae bacterium]
RRNGKSISTLDLFAGNFTLVTGSDSGEWSRAAQRAARAAGIEFDVHAIAEPEFPEAYGIAPSGAVLVRPDGFVAWRAKDGEAASAEMVSRVLKTVLGRT